MRLITIGLFVAVPACAAPPSDPHDLPPVLREISGLAAAPEGAVYGHNDEWSIIYEIDPASGRVRRAFSIGATPVHGDFEGVASDGNHVYLVRSDGQLLSAAIDPRLRGLPYQAVDTGVGSLCEIEGLSLSPTPGSLLILCKRLRSGREGARLRIYEWRSGAPSTAARRWLDLDLSEWLGAEAAHVAPSAIEWFAASRRIIVLSARNQMLMILDENGGVQGIDRLSPSRHPQAEGVAVDRAGRLIIADEGVRGRPGRLTVYAADHLRQLLSRRRAIDSGELTSSKNRER